MEASLWTDRLRLDRQLNRERVERALDRRYGERLDLASTDLEEVAKLEELFGRWHRASTVKYASLILHRAVVDVDPAVTHIWAPHILRTFGSSRAHFSQGLRALHRARDRGRVRGDLVETALALLCDGLEWPSAGVPTPSHGARRCEGRSRAPQGSSGGARAGSGGSRRGGDRGDDSGGGGSDGSDGGSSGFEGSRRRRFNWRSVSTVCGVISTLLAVANFAFGPLNAAPPSASVAPKIIIEEVRVPSARARPQAKSGHPCQAAEPGALGP